MNEEEIDDSTLDKIFEGAQADFKNMLGYMNYMRAMFAMIAALLIKSELCTTEEFQAMEKEARKMSGYEGAEGE